MVTGSVTERSNSGEISYAAASVGNRKSHVGYIQTYVYVHVFICAGVCLPPAFANPNKSVYASVF